VYVVCFAHAALDFITLLLEVTNSVSGLYIFSYSTNFILLRNRKFVTVLSVSRTVTHLYTMDTLTEGCIPLTAVLPGERGWGPFF
jgi:hypothetical protein